MNAPAYPNLQPATFNLQLSAPRRRPGPPSKITKLPPDLRALVNQLLDHGKPYKAVIEEMSKHGVILNHDNVSKWFNGPYQEYLAACQWRDDVHTLRDDVLTVCQDPADGRFQEGLVEIGLTYLFRSLKENHHKEDPANSIRLFNSLARLSHQALALRKFTDQQSSNPEH